MVDRSSDPDPAETAEWLEALESVFRTEGIERGHYLIERLIDQARRSGAHLPYSAATAYLNTIHVRDEPPPAGEPGLEHRIRSLVRWNALAMVVQANRENAELGGHIATFASAATLYDVGFNHFWKGPEHPEGADLLYVQGHSSPGIYSRAFLEGRLSEDQLHRFRQEVGRPGLSSYPHPWLMPDFWQFPTVSMGLGPIMAIYQARFMKYLEHRGLAEMKGRKVWCFVGDGETDEPESLGAIGLAARENLDNLIFVVNCNLQRLDGPVRGNGKIIQELEGTFRGAGWNVIKVIWGDRWDPLLAKDKKGLLLERMEKAVDGDYQNYKVRGGAYTRQHFFGTHPELLAMVANLTDDDIWQLNRGGHDPSKIYAAYHAAVKHAGQPTVILAKTVKGYGMGEAGEGKNFTHQQKKLGDEAVRKFRDRYRIPIPDEKIAEAPFYKPERGQPRDPVHARAPQGARRLPAGAPPRRAEAGDPRALDLRLAAQGLRRPRHVHHDGLRAHARRADARQEARQVRGADRAGRVAHLRHGGPVPAGRHLLLAGPALRARGLRHDRLLPRGSERPDPAGGNQRGGRAVVVDRGGHVLREPRPADAALLHLLLDVRLPARGRSDLGRGRLAHARLPARRHGRTHDPRGRRPPAPGRPQPRDGGDRAELPRLGSRLRLRARRDPARRHAAHARASRRTSSTTSP